MPVKIPTRLITLNRRVCTLYKTWLRYVEGDCDRRTEYYFKYPFCRREFDHIINQKDPRIMKQLLIEKENELEKMKTYMFSPPVYATSPEGSQWETHMLYEDWLLDVWHPFEKAEYPDYFAKRELRKIQYIEMWEKQYGPPPPVDH